MALSRHVPRLVLAAALAAPAAWPGPAAAGVSPTAAVTSPSRESVLPVGVPVVLAGSAANGEAGGITGVEVSVDGGDWQPAQGADSWRYAFTPGAAGTVTVAVRATAQGVTGQPAVASYAVGAGTPPPRSCPCTFVPPTPPEFAVLDEQDPDAVEVGVRFRVDRDGYLTGLVFYHHAANTGPHVGHVWSADGQLLAEATLTGATGLLPRIAFDPPVPVTAGSAYVVSYYTPSGHYASSIDYFGGEVLQPPFETLYDGNGGAGVYRYGGGFPDQTWRDSNYWVEPVFAG